MDGTFFAVHKALEYGWVSIPYHLMMSTKLSCRIVIPDLV
jgi:hypothetical protein